jgi:hypothetical protein
MKKLDIIPIALIVLVIGMGAWTILIEYPKEQGQELEESKVTASLILQNDDLTCEILSERLFTIGLEDFDGHELIHEALLLKHEEKNCEAGFND